MLPGFVIGDRGLSASGDTHPYWMMAHAMAGSYLAVGASAVGQIHLARGLPRDDGFVIRSIGPWMAVAVADGVGSRPLSRYAATYAVEALTSLLLRPFSSLSKVTQTKNTSGELISAVGGLAPPAVVDEVELKAFVGKKGGGASALKSNLALWSKRISTDAQRKTQQDASSGALRQVGSIGWRPSSLPVPPESHSHQPDSSSVPSAVDEHNLTGIMRQAFEKTHLGLREHARSLDLELADMSCTALALLLHLDTGRAVVGQVGDGAILGLTSRGKAKELVEPEDTGDPQSTYTLNRPNFDKYLAVSLVEPPPANPYLAFYLMTDGLSGDLLYSSQPGALDDWVQKVDHNLRYSSSSAQAAAGMLNWLATYQVQGSWDDRTLVVITQTEREHGNSQPDAGQSGSTTSTDDR